MTTWEAVCLTCGHEWTTPDDAVRFCPECEGVDVTAMETVAPEAERLAEAQAQLRASFATIQNLAGQRAAAEALLELDLGRGAVDYGPDRGPA